MVRAVRSIRKRSEVIVERMVLHHHDNDVIDLPEALGRGERYMIRAGACAERREHREEEAAVPIDAHSEVHHLPLPIFMGSLLGREGSRNVTLVLGLHIIAGAHPSQSRTERANPTRFPTTHDSCHREARTEETAVSGTGTSGFCERLGSVNSALGTSAPLGLGVSKK